MIERIIIISAKQLIKKVKLNDLEKLLKHLNSVVDCLRFDINHTDLDNDKQHVIDSIAIIEDFNNLGNQNYLNDDVQKHLEKARKLINSNYSYQKAKTIGLKISQQVTKAIVTIDKDYSTEITKNL